MQKTNLFFLHTQKQWRTTHKQKRKKEIITVARARSPPGLEMHKSGAQQESTHVLELSASYKRSGDGEHRHRHANMSASTILEPFGLILREASNGV
jgi:hypothetical protein